MSHSLLHDLPEPSWDALYEALHPLWRQQLRLASKTCQARCDARLRCATAAWARSIYDSRVAQITPKAPMDALATRFPRCASIELHGGDPHGLAAGLQLLPAGAWPGVRAVAWRGGAPADAVRLLSRLCPALEEVAFLEPATATTAAASEGHSGGGGASGRALALGAELAPVTSDDEDTESGASDEGANAGDDDGCAAEGGGADASAACPALTSLVARGAAADSAPPPADSSALSPARACVAALRGGLPSLRRLEVDLGCDLDAYSGLVKALPALSALTSLGVTWSGPARGTTGPALPRPPGALRELELGFDVARCRKMLEGWGVLNHVTRLSLGRHLVARWPPARTAAPWAAMSAACPRLAELEFAEADVGGPYLGAPLTALTRLTLRSCSAGREASAGGGGAAAAEDAAPPAAGPRGAARHLPALRRLDADWGTDACGELLGCPALQEARLTGAAGRGVHETVQGSHRRFAPWMCALRRSPAAELHIGPGTGSPGCGGVAAYAFFGCRSIPQDVWRGVRRLTVDLAGSLHNWTHLVIGELLQALEGGAATLERLEIAGCFIGAPVSGAHSHTLRGPLSSALEPLARFARLEALALTFRCEPYFGIPGGPHIGWGAGEAGCECDITDERLRELLLPLARLDCGAGVAGGDGAAGAALAAPKRAPLAVSVLLPRRAAREGAVSWAACAELCAAVPGLTINFD